MSDFINNIAEKQIVGIFDRARKDENYGADKVLEDLDKVMRYVEDSGIEEGLSQAATVCEHEVDRQRIYDELSKMSEKFLCEK